MHYTLYRQSLENATHVSIVQLYKFNDTITMLFKKVREMTEHMVYQDNYSCSRTPNKS